MKAQYSDLQKLLDEFDAIVPKIRTALRQRLKEVAEPQNRTSTRDHSQYDVGDGVWRVKTQTAILLVRRYADGRLTAVEAKDLLGQNFVPEAEYLKSGTDRSRFHPDPIVTADGKKLFVKDQWAPSNFSEIVSRLQSKHGFELRVRKLTPVAREVYRAAGLRFREIDTSNGSNN